MNYRYTLSELFEIKLGVAIVSKKESVKEVGELRYKVIYVSDLKSEYKTLDFNTLTPYATDKQIKPTKLLSHNDYVMSCKGEVKGLSLNSVKDIFPISDESGYAGILVSNHFIILRPRQTTLNIFNNITFLHNILDLLLPQINEYVKQKIDGKKLPFITISELERFSIQLPGGNGLQEKTEAFDNIYTEWRSKYEELRKLIKIMGKFNNSLLNDLKIEFPSV